MKRPRERGLARKRRLRALFERLRGEYAPLLPNDVAFHDERWNLISWTTRRGNSSTRNVIWSKIKNKDLRNAIKLFLLHRRFAAQLSGQSVPTVVNHLRILDAAVGALSIEQFTTAHFLDAKRMLLSYPPSTQFRAADYLESFGRWLHLKFGLPIVFKNPIQNPIVVGRYGLERERQKHLIPIDAIRQLIAARHGPDVSERDRFFINVLILFVATGARVGEIATLPKDCILDDANEGFGLIYFPEKRNKPTPRWIPSAFVPAVREAIKAIELATQRGREIATAESPKTRIDWRAVYREPRALQYFAERFLHDWTMRPENRITAGTGRWMRGRRAHVDLGALLKAHNGNKSAAARTLGVVRNHLYYMLKPRAAGAASTLKYWDNDPRIVSVSKFLAYTGVSAKGDVWQVLNPLISKAIALQIAGKTYPLPRRDLDFEASYRRSDALLVDKNGKVLLSARNALFVIPRYLLSDVRATKHSSYSSISRGLIVRWFSGERRSHGTRNHEDSCWSRLGIVDPANGQPYTFTSHDFRRWLNTTYQQGGLTEEQIALLFGRTTTGANATYDQTPWRDRISRLRDAVRTGHALGRLAGNYNQLARVSRQEAEAYLEASTMMISLMPHGGCTHLWLDTPCPHHLGCFAAHKPEQAVPGICEMLVIDRSDKQQIAEIERISKESALLHSMLPADSPQKAHAENVRDNTRQLLSSLEAAQTAPMPERERWITDDER